MKNKLPLVSIAFALLLPFAPVRAAADLQSDLDGLVGRIKAKLVAGQRTEAGLAAELKEFDALVAAHAGEKTDEVVQVLVVEASLYAQVLENPEKALEIFGRVRTEFPNTEAGRQAPEIVVMLQKQVAAVKIQRELEIGRVFPGFDEKDTAGRPLSVAAYRGKVLLVDFWATWCGPCVAEMPNVVAAYEKHHAEGFEIVGISLDREGDGDKLAKFTQDHKMPWPQFFDGKYWENKLSTKYGVSSIPASYLLDAEGRIIGKDLRGPELDDALTKALAKK